MEEQWKEIKGFDLYQISNFGRIKSYRKNFRGKLLKFNICKGGYYQVGLWRFNKVNTKWVHRLVWDNFGDKPRNGYKLQVDHIDGNKLNNRIDNLQLLNNRQNTSKSAKIRNKYSKHTGVSWHKINKKWSANIYINKKNIWLGGFDSEIEAYKAYQKKLKEINE